MLLWRVNKVGRDNKFMREHQLLHHHGTTSDLMENQNSRSRVLCQDLMRVARFRYAAGNANSRRRVSVVKRYTTAMVVPEENRKEEWNIIRGHGRGLEWTTEFRGRKSEQPALIRLRRSINAVLRNEFFWAKCNKMFSNELCCRIVFNTCNYKLPLDIIIK